MVASSTERDGNNQSSALATGRSLLLRDSLNLLGLIFVTLVLFAVTLFLFRSFAAHQTELGRWWSDRGRVALAQGRPEQAVDSLRTALTYAPGERAYELLLAEALSEAGHADEAFNYFSELWDAEPGNGFINLELARISAAKHEQQQAVNFYRAAIDGTWEGDGVLRRRAVRLELSRYLLRHRDFGAARAELLIVDGNANNDPALDMELGQLFEQAEDQSSALDAYRRAAKSDPKQSAAFTAAGRLAYSMGEFATAQRWLREALSRESSSGTLPEGDRAQVSGLLKNADRILELAPSDRLSRKEVQTRVINLRDLVNHRLDACNAAVKTIDSPLQQIEERWSAGGRSASRSALLHDPFREGELLQLIFETEVKANQVCGMPTGDDALVILLARDPKAADR